jgi:hypothetical protein
VEERESLCVLCVWVGGWVGSKRVEHTKEVTISLVPHDITLSINSHCSQQLSSSVTCFLHQVDRERERREIEGVGDGGHYTTIFIYHTQKMC